MPISYKIRMKPEPEGDVPALPGCIIYGKDLEEVQSNALESIELYMESLKEHGEEVPAYDNVLEYDFANFV